MAHGIVCDLCGEITTNILSAGGHDVCSWCKDKLKSNIAMKCLSCGAYGFIPMNEANIGRIMFFIPLTFSEVVNADIVVIWNGCPACAPSKTPEIYLGG